jgi:ribonuclease VapC
MIVDTSALLAMLFREPEREEFARLIEESEFARISTATLLEASIVVDAKGDRDLSRRLDELVRALQLEIEPFSVEQASIARAAYADFGKGSGHPAGLNFGDCFAYSLATAMDEPLLFKGEDFARTDIRVAA